MAKLFCPMIWGILLASGIATQAHSQVLTQCGASYGYAYYLPGGYVPTDKAGWTEDSISPGSLSLSVINGEADLVFHDATGKARSSRSEGASIQILEASESGSIIVISSYPGGAFEHYFFRLNKNGEGEVIWGSLKWNGLVDKSSLYRADCKAP
jgi:hypothetical protein